MNTKSSEYNQAYICYCQYCGKECKNLNSLKQHQARCKMNSNRIHIDGSKYSHTAWNKGKTKDTDNRLVKQGENFKNNYYSGKFKTWNTGKTKDTSDSIKLAAEKISNTIKEKIKNDDWHLSFSKARTQIYKDIKFQGIWEVEFAKYLDKLNIEWIRPTEKFEYIYNNETCYYLPDFYLPIYDLYIEIKGYPTDRDFAKWDNFPLDKKLDIYFGDELKSMNIVDDIKNVYSNIPMKYRIKHIWLGSSEAEHLTV